MATVHIWRKLIGIFEILAGLLLVISSAFVFYIFKSSILGELTELSSGKHVVDIDSELLIQISVLLLMLMVGLVILVNGIWKIRSNKFIKTNSMQG